MKKDSCSRSWARFSCIGLKNCVSKVLSIVIVVMMCLSGMFMLISSNTTAPTVTLSHDAGNLYFRVDNHATVNHFMRYNGVIQSDDSGSSYDYTHFFFDQANYEHKNFLKDIATGGYAASPTSPDEYDTTAMDVPLSLLENDAISGTIDKSYGSFTKVKDINGQANDTRLFQTAWSKQGEDWGIIQWRILNLYPTDLTEVRFGLKFDACINSDDGDDTDNWDAAESIFYFNDTGSSTHIGFASADPGTPINLYVGKYSVNLRVDAQIYDSISGNDPCGTSGTTTDLSCVVGWTDDSVANNGLVIPAGQSTTRTLIMAGGNSYSELVTAIDRARQFYLSQMLTITEISDEGTPRVEIYNEGTISLDLTNFRLSVDGGATYWTGGFWNPTVLPGQGYSVWTLGGTDAFDSTEGDTIGLYDTGDILYDEVPFGQEGVAPDPINDASIGSISRIYNDEGYTEEWVHSLHGMTFNSANSELPIDTSPNVVLNEVMFNPAAPEFAFIEIMYIGDTSINIQDYYLICDYVSQFMGLWILDNSDRYAIMWESDAPLLFQNMDPGGDNVYLYHSSGALMDMVGWNTPHQVNKTMTRVPDGFGTYQGFNNVTSEAAGWVFDQIPTMPLVNIYPKDQFEYGNVGGEVWFFLNIVNKQSFGDLFDIINASLLNGWQVEIYLDDMTTMLTDTDGDGYPDIWIAPGGSVEITIKVTIPNVLPLPDFEDTIITAISDGNSAISDSAVLQTRVYPYILPEKIVNPSTVYVKGTGPGYEEEATVTLTLTGAGYPTTEKMPQDVIFLIDISGSMAAEDIQMAQRGAIEYVNQLEEPDRAAVMYFTGQAQGMPPCYNPFFWCEHPLTTDYDAVRMDLERPMFPDQNTWIASAINGSVNEFLRNGDPSHLWVVVLLSDGGNNDPSRDLWIEVANAAGHGIVIYTIGLGSMVNQWELEEIARQTGGEYFYARDASDLIEVYLAVADTVNEIAGWDMDITDAFPMVRDVLPPWIDYVPWSFSITPDYIYVNESGYTIIEWNISKISIGQVWTVQFTITTDNFNTWPSNHFDTSRIYYMNCHDELVTRLFPEAYITGILPKPDPPNLFIDAVDDTGIQNGQGKNILLSWEPPPQPWLSHYLIYRSEDQTRFDFSMPWVDTSDAIIGVDPVDGLIKPLRTTWNATNASDPNNPKEMYYIIRAVNAAGEASITSRTVGKLTKQLEAGTSTFSLPLEPIFIMDTDWYTQDMNANYIRWMNLTTRNWIQHDFFDGGNDNTLMAVGEGYEANLPNPINYTYTGMPGAMIWYDDVLFGFDASPSDGNARNLSAEVDPLNGDIALSWDPATGNDVYFIFHSNQRDGFWNVPNVLAMVSSKTGLYTHFGAALNGAENYYMVVPSISATGEIGIGTYSIGVWNATYANYDAIGLPLKLDSTESIDWYCDRVPNAWGMNYYNIPEQRWMWHKTIMPAGIYDTDFESAVGYQISTGTDTHYNFIGR